MKMKRTRKTRTEVDGLLRSGAIHGLIYVTGQGHIFFKFLWFCIVAAGLTIGAILVHTAVSGSVFETKRY